MANGEIVGNKFHKVAGSLSVALEATFPSGENLEYSPEFSFPELINRTNPLVTRVYHPARNQGDLNNGGLRIVFIPWMMNEAEFHRLVFRGKGGESKEIVFARFPQVVDGKVIDDKTFGFVPSKPPFINLDFFSKRSDEFTPLFVKIDGHLFKISAEIGEEEVALVISKVPKVEVPSHLAAAYGN